MVSILIDHRPTYVEPAGSLLLMPLGGDSCLSHAIDCMGLGEDARIIVSPTFPVSAKYADEVTNATSHDVQVAGSEQLSDIVREMEASERLLVFDPINWPVKKLDVRAESDGDGDYRGVTHYVVIGAEPERVSERIESDSNGRVRRIRRSYLRMSWPSIGNMTVVASVLPPPALLRSSLRSLAESRLDLCSKGFFCRDIPVECDALDLSEEAGILALNERIVSETFNGKTNGAVRKNEEIRVGRGCAIHASCRLTGPIVLHDRVRIEAGATIVGPTVVGADSLIDARATVAQCLLDRGTVVEPDAALFGRVVAGRVGGEQGEAVEVDYSPLKWAQLSMQGNGGRGIEFADKPPRWRRRAYLGAKRLFDATTALAGLVVLSPFLVLLALVMKLDSPGPVLFIHWRERKNGKPFPCLKFRTMAADAHRHQRRLDKENEVDGPQFKIKNDPRITRLGHWLRATNIDELPQLINVLLGHMSLVGPRPSPFRENQICVPWRRARLSVAPGITGLWQLCRDKRTEGDFHQWIYYDTAYVRNVSLWMDIKILVATVLTLGGRWRVPPAWLLPADQIS